MSGRLAIVGLGPGSVAQLSLAALERMRQSEIVLFRTKEHPVWLKLDELAIQARSLDYVYEEEPSLERVYARLAEEVLKEASQRDTAYCVPGSPLFAEASVKLLLAEAEKCGVEVELIAGRSSLDAAIERLRIDPLEGLQVMDAQALPSEFDARLHLLIFQVDNAVRASEVKLALLEWYPQEHPIAVLQSLGAEARHVERRETPEVRKRTAPARDAKGGPSPSALDDKMAAERAPQIRLAELDRQAVDHLTTLYVPPLAAEKRKPTFADLVAIMAKLRSEEGCPWDREQDHRSLRGALLEEAYETLEAIDKDDPDALCQELGDVLLQVVFHAQLGKEEGFFDHADVVKGLCDKLIERHPHVFGGENLETAQEVLSEWEGRKRQQRGQSVAEQMADAPRALPSLARAEEVLRRAVRAGFAWPDFEHAWRKFEEELGEFHREANQTEASEKQLSWELGDVLMTLCSLAVMKQIDPEQALRETVTRFIERFRSLESKTEGRPLEQFSLEELLSLWKETASDMRIKEANP